MQHGYLGLSLFERLGKEGLLLMELLLRGVLCCPDREHATLPFCFLLRPTSVFGGYHGGFLSKKLGLHRLWGGSEPERG